MAICDVVSLPIDMAALGVALWKYFATTDEDGKFEKESLLMISISLFCLIMVVTLPRIGMLGLLRWKRLGSKINRLNPRMFTIAV